jgi:hypothetical protein
MMNVRKAMNKKPTKQELIAKCEELTRERDEARRMYLASTFSEDEIIHEMKRHGWNCFKQNTDYLQDLG